MNPFRRYAVRALLIGFCAIGPLHIEAARAAASPNEFAKTVELAGKTLVLNGKGERTATLFKIKVYDAAFYNPTLVTNEDGVFSSDYPKRLEFRYARDFSLEKTREAWTYQFKESALVPAETYAAGVAKLREMSTEIRKGMVHRFDIHRDKVDFSIDDRKVGTIEGAPFVKALLNVFFSKNPPTKDLKKGLLGEK